MASLDCTEETVVPGKCSARKSTIRALSAAESGMRRSHSLAQSHIAPVESCSIPEAVAFAEDALVIDSRSATPAAGSALELAATGNRDTA